MPFGTLAVLDDLENESQTVADFGEAELAARFTEALDLHNELVQETLADFVAFTDQPQLPYGVADTVEMFELDELGQADAVKAFGAGNMGFPLRLYGGALQWTRMYLQRQSVANIATQLDALAAADLRNMHRQFRRALFNPVNGAYVDVNDTGLTLQLKALLNADGGPVPPGPNGETFSGGSHTHYLGTASLTRTNVVNAIDTVIEHNVTGGVRIYINRAQEAAFRALDGFEPYVYAGIQQPSDTSFATGQALDMRNPNDRAIGVFEGAEVLVKPWIYTGYIMVFDTGVGGMDKVLAVRTRSGGLTGMGAFTLVYEHEHYPLRARQYAREFGVSVLQRHKAAILYTGGGTYTVPSTF